MTKRLFPPKIIDEPLTPTRRAALALLGMGACAAALGQAAGELTLSETGLGPLLAELKRLGALSALSELAAAPEIASLSLFEAEDALATVLTAGKGRSIQRYQAAVSADAARGKFVDLAGILLPAIAASLARVVGGEHADARPIADRTG